MIKKRPWVCMGLTVCLLNLAGLPIPPAGFLAKFFVFWYGVQMSMTFNSPIGFFLVGAGLLTSVPAVYYYSRVAIKMIVREPSAKVLALPERRRQLVDSPAGPILAVLISMVGILAGSFAVTPIMNFTLSAVMSLGQTPVAYLP